MRDVKCTLEAYLDVVKRRRRKVLVVIFCLFLFKNPMLDCCAHGHALKSPLFTTYAVALVSSGVNV